jgi:N-acetyl-gamma-glutamyl-phosphate reductase
VVAALRERGVRVVDLSADFRLHDRATYEDWYGEHGAPELLADAVYGLPELHRGEIAGAALVANPGCYPTAAILALAPLARAGMLGDVVIDAKSGVSGAGREPTHGKHFVTVDETVTPYKVGAHRHTPEIEQELGGGTRVTFTAHLVPLAYGELVSCYVTPRGDVGSGAGGVAALYAGAYGGEPWVEVVEGPPGMHEVRETNFCRISVHDDTRTGRVIVFATLDNLWKGTSSQAVQNLNLMFGRDESEGLHP